MVPWPDSTSLPSETSVREDLSGDGKAQTLSLALTDGVRRRDCGPAGALLGAKRLLPLDVSLPKVDTL
jgi:hypothetical protein